MDTLWQVLGASAFVIAVFALFIDRSPSDQLIAEVDAQWKIQSEQLREIALLRREVEQLTSRLQQQDEKATMLFEELEARLKDQQDQPPWQIQRVGSGTPKPEIQNVMPSDGDQDGQYGDSR